MNEARREKSYSSDKKKKRKKHKKKYESSPSDSESESKTQWVEASPPHKTTSTSGKKKKKHKKKKYESSSSGSELDSDERKCVDGSTQSNVYRCSGKKKKKHRKKKHASSESSDESSNVEMQRVEVPAPNTLIMDIEKKSSSSGISTVESPSINAAKEERESWMNEECFVSTVSKSEMLSGSSAHQRRADRLKEKQEKDDEIRTTRELNPYWKNGGEGLPEKETNVESLNLPSASSGDGGYSYLKKAYYRIQEQAQQEGKSMEEIAVERWGSLGKLKSMIKEAEERMKRHPDHKKYSHHYHKSRYDEDSLRSKRDLFKKPDDDSCESESNHRFNSQFEFRKPSNENKCTKKVNEFKSSRKYNFYDYSQSEKESEGQSSSSYSESLVSEKHSKSVNIKDSPSSEKRVPAWKKPKYVEDQKSKELPKNSPTETNYPVPEKKDVAKSSTPDENVLLIYSDDDLSKLAAKQIKAEIMGDKVLASKFKQQLDEARKRVKERGFDKQPEEHMEEVILTKLGSQGQAHPIQTTSEKILDAKQKKPKKYFDDDSRYSLKQMFEREKLTTVDDQMKMFVEAASKYDETSEVDFESGISKKLTQKMSTSCEEEKDILKAMHQHKKLTERLEKCEHCPSRAEQYLIVDEGKKVYISLPKFKTLAEGHCLIIPWTHVSSFLSLDEDVWEEVETYKSLLRSMFQKQKKSVIFLETSMNFRRYPHARVECIPVPEEEGHMAPFYFKKAIQESEAEWAHNKKLIDLKNKGLRHSVPRNLPYFHVEFDPNIHAGFAHVIEEERRFPPNFGKEVIGGMLDIDYNYLYKNKREQHMPDKTKEVIEFRKMWQEFNKNEKL